MVREAKHLRSRTTPELLGVAQTHQGIRTMHLAGSGGAPVPATRSIERTPRQAIASAIVQVVLRLRMPIRIRESARSAQDDSLVWE
jgi:hypothetical protein